MRRSILAAVLAAGVLLAPTAAFADKPPVKGHFIAAEKRAGQPHRAYFRVGAGKGSKECEVSLFKTISVTLGVDGESGWSHIFYLRSARATRAVALANAILGEPTDLVLCSH